MSNKKEKLLKGGKATLIISQADLATAVAFWLNERILKSPVVVTYIDKQRDQFMYGFTVDFIDEANKNENSS